jgi:hypothetical protein
MEWVGVTQHGHTELPKQVGIPGVCMLHIPI